jgi:hypothetical protein
VTAYLEVFGWLAVLGGVVLALRGLLLHSTLRGDPTEPGRKPAAGLTHEGRRALFLGLLLIVVGHVLKDVIPGFLAHLAKAAT